MIKKKIMFLSLANYHWIIAMVCLFFLVIPLLSSYKQEPRVQNLPVTPSEGVSPIRREFVVLRVGSHEHYRDSRIRRSWRRVSSNHVALYREGLDRIYKHANAVLRRAKGLVDLTSEENERYDVWYTMLRFMSNFPNKVFLLLFDDTEPSHDEVRRIRRRIVEGDIDKNIAWDVLITHTGVAGIARCFMTTTGAIRLLNILRRSEHIPDDAIYGLKVFRI